MLTAPVSAAVGSPVTIELHVNRPATPPGPGMGAMSPAHLDLGDGSTAAPIRVSETAFTSTSHTYTEPGTYYVRATVQDEFGAMPPGVTGPENVATAVTTVKIYPWACQGPSGSPVMTLPATVTLERTS